jgi:hypothetical protein
MAGSTGSGRPWLAHVGTKSAPNTACTVHRLVPQRDWASPTAGHKPDRFQTSQTAARASTPEEIVIEATGASVLEARAVIALIEQTSRPRSVAGFVRRLVADDDLAPRLEEVRSAQHNRDVAQLIAEARKGPQCVHGEPGGASPHPSGGRPLCALCRRAELRVSA